MTKVFVDPGHGGRDPGATGHGLKEKDITLAVSLKVGDILERHGIEVIYSRTTDVYVSLADRTNMANRSKAKIFVSIHVNSATNTSARGIETFSHPTSSQGAKLSKSIQDRLVESKIFSHDRGTKTANFHVLRASSMPASLTELGFIVNYQDAQLLKNRQDEMALAIAKGVLDYLGVPFQDGNTVKLNIKGVDILANGFNKNNTNYIKIGRHDIPVRDLGQALNLDVSWDDKNKVVRMK